MSEKACLTAVKAAVPPRDRELVLESGRRVAVSSNGEEEILEVSSPSGEVEIRVTLAADGPVLRLSGARIDISAAEEMTLSARRISVLAEDAAELKSNGRIDIDAREEMKIHSEEDVRVTGEIIHLN